jgi:hypothetical protein
LSEIVVKDGGQEVSVEMVLVIEMGFEPVFAVLVKGAIVFWV